MTQQTSSTPRSAGTSTAASSPQNSGQSQCDHYKSLRDQYIQVDPRWQFWNAAYANCRLLNASGGFSQPVSGPSVGISTAPVTTDPGSFFTDPTGGPAKGDVTGVNLGDIGGYLHKAAEHLTDPAFWKGSGLVLAGGVVLIIGFLMWSGIGQATIEGTAPAQAYRRAQSGGVQNVRQKREPADGE